MAGSRRPQLPRRQLRALPLLGLAIITGDARTATLIALAAPSRPSAYFDADSARSPWVTPADIRQKGAVVVWLTAGTGEDAAARNPGAFS